MLILWLLAIMKLIFNYSIGKSTIVFSIKQKHHLDL